MRGVISLALLLGLACVAAVGAQDSSNTDSNAIVKLANIIADSEMKPAAPVQHSLLAKATLEFWPAFLASIAVIVISELGDKTFFIAAIMAMRHNRVSVFLGAIAALGVMTVLSAAMGYALPSILPREYTHFASIVLFLFFGVKLLKDAYGMSADEPNEELDEVESELDKKEIELGSVEMEGGHREEKVRPVKVTWKNLFSPIFVQCFTMTFLAEWGDRSQISTIAMAAVKNPYGVTIGGILGHALCTGLAVLGGKLVATKISEKTVATLGGFLFLFFALHGMYTGPSSE